MKFSEPPSLANGARRSIRQIVTIICTNVRLASFVYSSLQYIRWHLKKNSSPRRGSSDQPKTCQRWPAKLHALLFCCSCLPLQMFFFLLVVVGSFLRSWAGVWIVLLPPNPPKTFNPPKTKEKPTFETRLLRFLKHFKIFKTEPYLNPFNIFWSKTIHTLYITARPREK